MNSGDSRMLKWIVLYIFLCLLFRWLILSDITKRFGSWGWTSDQNKLYLSIMWVFSTFVFLYGIFNSSFRNAFLLEYLF